MAVRTLFLDVRDACRPETDLFLNSVRFIDRERVTPIVVCREDSPLLWEYRRIEDVIVVPLALPDVDPTAGGFWPKRVFARMRAATRLALAVRELARQVKYKDIELIYTQAQPWAMAILNTARRFVKLPPYVLHCHAAFDGTRGYYQAVRNAATVLANTRFTADTLRPVLDEGEQTIEVLYDGVTLPPIGVDKDIVRWQQGLTDESCCTAVLGQTERPGWVEGFFEYVPDIVRDCPECCFLFADTGPARGFEERERSVRNVAAQYRLSDRVSVLRVADDYSRIAAAADVILAPTWNEQTSQLVLESFAHRKPVIGCVAGGMQELLQNAAGFLLPPRDFVNLSDAVIQLTGSPSLRSMLANRGNRRFLECFHLARYLGELTSILSLAPLEHSLQDTGGSETEVTVR